MRSFYNNFIGRNIMEKDFQNDSSKKRGRPRRNSKTVQSKKERKPKLSDKKE